MYVFVTSRVINNYKEGHSRKLQTFSMCKVSGSRGIGKELRESFTLIFSLKCFFVVTC